MLDNDLISLRWWQKSFWANFCAQIDKKRTIPWYFIIETNILQYFSSRGVLMTRHKGHYHSGPKILHFGTSLQPSVTTTHDFDHMSLWPVISTIRHNDKNPSVFGFFVGVTACRNDVLKWRMVEVTCRSDWWLKSHVEVKDFGSWEGVALVSKWRLPATEGLWNPNSWLKIFKQSQT